MKFEEIAKLGASRLERVRVRSALNPIIWLSIATAALSWSAAWFFRNHTVFAAVLIGSAACPSLLLCCRTLSCYSEVPTDSNPKNTSCGNRRSG